MEIQKFASINFSLTQSIRQDLHRHPELGFQEFRTASIISKYLNNFNFRVTENIGKTGVIGVLDTGRPGRSLLMRFDMDALPVQEEKISDYSSQNTGVMHACGHDGHVAVGLTVGKILSENVDSLNGRIITVFQPAEEGLGGAESMLAEHILENLKPDAALAFHLWNEKPIGWLGVNPGPLMAGADLVKITITGKGGHGAIPQEAVDPVIAAAQVLIGLQSIVSRNISPLDSAIVSITEFHAGDAHNIIPSQAVMQGSIRSFSKSTRDLVISRVQRISESIAFGMGCTSDVNIIPLTPPVINSPLIADLVTVTAQKVLPSLAIDRSYQVMVSDDMALFLEKIPGCYILVGSADKEKGLIEHHHNSKFDFSESAMESAVILLTGFAENYLNPN
jgi:amidohydrolase